MAKKTYTKYNLTDHMLQRLSAIVKGKEHAWGMPLKALHDRDLVAASEDNNQVFGGYYVATQEGVKALEQARKEGW